MSVTLHDVARLAGVSAKTVSRVVNNQGEISEATRVRVQQAIEQLGYHPNYVARSLVNQRSNIIAVVAWGIEYYGPSRIVVGIEQKANELGYLLFLNLLPDPQEDRADQLLSTLLAHRVEGIIWAIPEVGKNRAWLNTTRWDTLPPMVFMNMEARPDLMGVSVNNRLGGNLAAQHLMEQGRRRIGIIAGHLDWWEARERYLGWQEALKQAGFSPDPALMVEADWSIESGAEAMRTLLARTPTVDAVFASSDHIALGALSVIHQSGRLAPADIALVGFDNIPESRYLQPPLTTIHQPLIDIGRQAVTQLQNMIAARHNQAVEPARQILLPPELIVRASSRSS